MQEYYFAFCGEGDTDNRFYPNIIDRLIEDFMIRNKRSVSVQWKIIKKVGDSSTQILVNAAREAFYNNILFFHRDSSGPSRDSCIEVHFREGLQQIENEETDVCKQIVPTIPVQETEAWILADNDLLRRIIGINISNESLGLTHSLNNIEHIRDPKNRIENAIRIFRESLSPRRRRNSITINDIYQPFSQQVSIDRLNNLPAFRTFREEIRRITNILSTQV